MATHLTELQHHIQIFMSKVISFTAQWINKPKFHHLYHLPQSILRCGGPASLLSTEKFKSYNGVLRHSSTHSNKQAPAKDIAINFSNYQALRFLLLGGAMYNKETQKATTCSPEILNLFENSRPIQKSFEYNVDLLNPSKEFPFAKQTKSQVTNPSVPTSLANRFPSGTIEQVNQLQLNRHDIIQPSYFVLDIKSTLNLQHDCYRGKCKVTNTRSTQIERLETSIKTPEVIHQDDNFFILNSASLHEPEHHWRIADLPIEPVPPSEWLNIA
ncbi:hypothetical protein PCANC_28696 [Puccinia coronata f. sp. avenae]|uniref:Uncharacterized protein n=1 Tax=Puccinia coronata f. sp. avenae TaxID=200324 RepID=A0A2N5RVU9_9BASI|nr:hypothetical protein PCANC_28696 [Puccinia coronata f. sp. avenae]